MDSFLQRHPAAKLMLVALAACLVGAAASVAMSWHWDEPTAYLGALFCGLIATAAIVWFPPLILRWFPNSEAPALPEWMPLVTATASFLWASRLTAHCFGFG